MKRIIIMAGLALLGHSDEINILTMKCTTCHGDRFERSALGKSEIIAGWDTDKTYTALQAYQLGTRNTHGMGRLMSGQVGSYTDKELWSMAEYITTLKSTPPKAVIRLRASSIHSATPTPASTVVVPFSPPMTTPVTYLAATPIASPPLKPTMTLNAYEQTILTTYLQSLPGRMVSPKGTNTLREGQKFYLRYLKASFGMNGTRFSSEHTTAEWEELFANNGQKFIQTYAQRFPNALPVLTHPAMLDGILSVGTFAKEYSSDGGNIVE
ncbi:MAG: c-type cytochrome [Sulfuricurvum sp.]